MSSKTLILCYTTMTSEEMAGKTKPLINISELYLKCTVLKSYKASGNRYTLCKRYNEKLLVNQRCVDVKKRHNG